MSAPVSRRDALKHLALVVGAAGALRSVDTRAATPERLTTTDPTASALGYHEDAKTVDAKQFSNYKPGQSCSNCAQLQGKDGEAYRPCAIFSGKLVNANGWCRVWVAKS